MMNTFRRILNSKGMVIISTLVIITVMIVIMVGIASMEVLTAARASSRVNEAFRYLNVMEEMGQIVARARLQGMATDSGGTCPTGYSVVNVATSGLAVNVCLVTGGVTSTCVDHHDYAGGAQRFCLRSLTGLRTTTTAVTPAVPAFAGTGVVGSGSETYSVSGANSNANYHVNEYWFPTISAASWPSSVNEIVTPTCSATPSDMWYGCQVIDVAGTTKLTYLLFTMCKPGIGGAVVTSCTDYTSQKIAVYY